MAPQCNCVRHDVLLHRGCHVFIVVIQLSAVGNGKGRAFINADFFNTGDIIGRNGSIGFNPDIADSSRYRVAAPVGNLVPIAIGYENIFFTVISESKCIICCCTIYSDHITWIEIGCCECCNIIGHIYSFNQCVIHIKTVQICLSGSTKPCKDSMYPSLSCGLFQQDPCCSIF